MAHENPKDHGHDQNDGSGDFKRAITQHAAQIQAADEKEDTHKRNQGKCGGHQRTQHAKQRRKRKSTDTDVLEGPLALKSNQKPNAESNGDLGCNFSRWEHANRPWAGIERSVSFGPALGAPTTINMCLASL